MKACESLSRVSTHGWALMAELHHCITGAAVLHHLGSREIAYADSLTC